MDSFARAVDDVRRTEQNLRVVDPEAFDSAYLEHMAAKERLRVVLAQARLSDSKKVCGRERGNAGPQRILSVLRRTP